MEVSNYLQRTIHQYDQLRNPESGNVLQRIYHVVRAAFLDLVSAPYHLIKGFSPQELQQIQLHNDLRKWHQIKQGTPEYASRMKITECYQRAVSGIVSLPIATQELPRVSPQCTQHITELRLQSGTNLQEKNIDDLPNLQRVHISQTTETDVQKLAQLPLHTVSLHIPPQRTQQLDDAITQSMNDILVNWEQLEVSPNFVPSDPRYHSLMPKNLRDTASVESAQGYEELFTDPQLASVLRTAYTSRLATLDLSSLTLTRELYTQLVGWCCEYLAQTTRIDFPHCADFADPQIWASKFLGDLKMCMPRLQHITIQGTGASSSEATVAVMIRPYARELQELGLSETPDKATLRELYRERMSRNSNSGASSASEALRGASRGPVTLSVTPPPSPREEEAS